MRKIVADSSVILKWLNQKDEKYLNQAENLLNDVRSGAVELLVPELAKYEIGNVLLVAKKLSSSQGNEVLDLFFSLPIQFYNQTQPLAETTYAIGRKLGLTYYDASFISLAKQENAILVTDNIKHQGKTSEIKVIPLSKYK